MTKGDGKAEVIDLKGLLACDEDFVHAAVEAQWRCQATASFSTKSNAASSP
jgi:hypothetical protein